ncbi:MAG: DEAD/DEAH box helicase [Bacteriovoracaceae bacterium]|nr:DEAD/DEAH box helicase [Bacteriovoracaceae bacterium]
MEDLNATMPEVVAMVEKTYAEPVRFQARRLVELGRVSLSFIKGSLDNHLVVSGIVSDNNTTYETKFTWKKETQTFQAKCNCPIWVQEESCVHGASLWLRWQQFSAAGNEQKVKTNSGPSFFGEGVSAVQYGTFIKQATYLQGSKPSSTFGSLSYLLTDRKVVVYPAPTKWIGTLVVNILPTTEDENMRELATAADKHFARFSWIDEEGTEIKEISVFDVFTMFNWRTGAAIDFPSDVMETIKSLKQNDPWMTVNEWLRIFRDTRDKPHLDLRIEGISWKTVVPHPIHWRFGIKPSARKSFLNLQIEIADEQDRLIEPPEPLKLFVTEGGWGGTFRTKVDACTFYRNLVEDFGRDTVIHRKHLHGASMKQRMGEWIDVINADPEIPFWDNDLKAFYSLSTATLKKVMIALLDSLTELAWKTVFSPPEERKLILQLPKNTVLENISGLHARLSVLGFPLMYNDVPIRNWKSAIRFERNQNRLDWFELDLVVSDEDLDLIKSAELTDNYILTDKGLVLLTDKEKDLLRFMKRYTKLEGEKKESGPGVRRFGLTLHRARVFELFELKRLGVDGALTREEEIFCERIVNLESMPLSPLPERYKDLARPYQATGYHWLRFLWDHGFGACLADDMGLGKTLQTIMLLQALFDEKKMKRAIIICPVSILYNWKNELEKFSNLKWGIFYGEEREIPEGTQVVLTSYGLMKKESLAAFAQEDFDMIIFDEVQHLKNIRSLGANAARQLKGKFRICLTGTPVENDLAEFYNIMDLCVPGVWGDLSLVRSSSKAKNRLLARKTVKPFILRRTKEQVLKELPEKVENHVFLDFSDGEREHYQNRLNTVKTQMSNPTFSKRYGEVLKSLLELRQMCLWQKQGASLYSTKVDFLMENLEQLMEENHKVLVFSQFTTYLDIIQDKIRTQGWKYARIDGSQAIKKRTEQVELFQEGDAKIFLISLKAGGFGLNLTAASYIFLMDPWWNPAVERQAVDRAHRIGQENKLTVYRPIMKNSVEEKVLTLQQAKRELFRDLMAEDDDQYFSGKLTKDDFSMLLG